MSYWEYLVGCPLDTQRILWIELKYLKLGLLALMYGSTPPSLLHAIWNISHATRIIIQAGSRNSQ